MKKALNEQGKMIDIIESVSTSQYHCPVCKKELIRNFGAVKQFYSHQKDVDATDCEIKMKLIIKGDKSIFQQSDTDILSIEFYNKQFDDVEVEMSDYMSEEGYWLTKEQKDIIFSTEDKVKVSALSGSAKSSTLYYFAKEHPFSKILYVVYNKSMQLESQNLFQSQKHVNIRTLHSIGYETVGKFYRDKLTFNYGVVDIIKDLNLNWDKDMELAVKINEMMKQYSLSSAETFSDLEIFKEDKMRGQILSLCEKLWNLKKKYKNSVKISHDDYLKMFHLSKTDLSNKYDIIMLDECLPASQYVKTNQGNKSIKKLYELYKSGEQLPNALSYNIEKDLFEYKPIVSAMKSDNREILEIQTEGLNKLHCTPNHKVLTQRGWIQAEDLIVGKDSMILDNTFNQKTKYKPNDDQLQIIMGSFLGDGSLAKQSKFNTYRLRFTQGEKQFEYFKSKIKAFDLSYKMIKSGYTQKLSVYHSDSTKVFLLEDDPMELLNDIEPLGLAIWYQDDGSYSHSGIAINSNQLTLEQTTYLRDIILNKYDIEFLISKSKDKYYYLRLNKESANRFLKLISPYMHPTMQYKTNINIANNVCEYNSTYLNHGGNYIKSINKVSNDDVYDIEVADNHNFITQKTSNKNASGVVVHNCQDSSMMMFDILKNSNVPNLIIVGDCYQQLYSWRQAVNIMPLFDAKEYKLTTSFRVSNNIAHIENLIISDFIGDNIKMKGFNTNQKIVDKIDKSKPYACLCRTNAYIFAEIADALYEDKDKKLFFVGGYSSYSFQSLKECFFYSQGHPTKNKLFSKFEDYYKMKTYAEDINDIELLSLIRMVDKYGSRIIDIVDGIKNNTVTDKDKADIIFSTIHKSKGLTLSMPVYISNDHLDLEVTYKNKYLKKDEDYGDKKKVVKDISEEIFCCYVAISRCSGQIELSDSIKRYLLMRYNHIGHELHNISNPMI